MEEDSDGMSGPGLTPGVSRNGPQKWKKAQQVNHQVEREAGWPDGRTVQGVSTTPKVKIKMKKLMIALAAAGLVGGAFAGNCTPDAPSNPDALVYQFKATVKTTKGTPAKFSASGSTCTPGSSAEGVIRLPDSTKFQGWIYDCDPSCNLLETGKAVVWDSKRKAQLTDAAFTTTFLNVMGKKQTDAEWAWTFAGAAAYSADISQTYALTGSGLGKYSKKGYYTSFSGNFAGTAAASYHLAKNAACDPSRIWKCDDLATLADSDTVAYGSWSVKYSSSASKKYTKNGYLKLPNYVTINP